MDETAADAPRRDKSGFDATVDSGGADHRADDYRPGSRFPDDGFADVRDPDEPIDVDATADRATQDEPTADQATQDEPTADQATQDEPTEVDAIEVDAIEVDAIEVDAIEVELIEFEADADEPVVVRPAGASVDDDIVDAELIDDPEDVVAQLEAPSAPPALTAAPFVHDDGTHNDDTHNDNIPPSDPDPEPAAESAAVPGEAREPADELTAPEPEPEPEPEEASDTASDAPGHDSPTYAEEADGKRPAQPAAGPAEPIRQRREQRADPRNRRTDPEQILAAYPVTYDPRTLREQIEDDEPMWVVIDRLTDKLEYAERDSDRARLLSLRAVASRLLGDLDPALEDATAALAHAEAAGELVRTAVVRARLAHVLQWRGDHVGADRIYAEVNTAELPARLRAEIHELAGRSAFEQGRYLEAVNHLEGALDLRKGTDIDLVERIELALDTITGRTTDGWGPYPRSREEILGRSGPARPERDETSGLFGYPGLLPPRFAQAQPFADGVAWVRRPEAPAWELIDESGALLIDASSGYRAAGRFADGLAWVSRDDAGGWHAIDQQNRVIVPGGFEDARPFHNGLALVRRGGWGAVDEHTRIVVQPHYQAFATMLASGEPVDGFTEEGLAVVDAGEVYGVVDRAGHLLVQPVHAALLIHPAAFLVADKYGLWGALNRKGEPLVELKYRERADVLDEIDKLIEDTRPVL